MRILDSLHDRALGLEGHRTLLFIDFWPELLPDAKLIIPIRHPSAPAWAPSLAENAGMRFRS